MRLFGFNSGNYKKKKQKPIHHVKGNYDAKNDRAVLHII